MARARNIKPSFFQNDALGELDPLARLLFVGLWTIADFKGCLEFRPKRIKAQLLPYDECSLDSLATALDKSGFIAIYSVQGQQYIKIVNFERHQNPHKNEREAGSEVPDIDKKDHEIKELKQDGKNREQDGTAPADSLFLIPDSLILNPESPSHVAPAGAVGSVAVVEEPPKTDRRREHRASVDVQEVFDYWKQVLNHPQAKLDAKRAKVIGARLADGYTVGDLCRAIDGCCKSPHHMGQNASRTVYDDIELICRDGSHVDGFIKKSDIPAGAAQRTSSQQQTFDNLQAYLERTA